jgi:hypothetical protein
VNDERGNTQEQKISAVQLFDQGIATNWRTATRASLPPVAQMLLPRLGDLCCASMGTRRGSESIQALTVSMMR